MPMAAPIAEQQPAPEVIAPAISRDVVVAVVAIEAVPAITAEVAAEAILIATITVVVVAEVAVSVAVEPQRVRQVRTLEAIGYVDLATQIARKFPRIAEVRAVIVATIAIAANVIAVTVAIAANRRPAFVTIAVAADVGSVVLPADYLRIVPIATDRIVAIGIRPVLQRSPNLLTLAVSVPCGVPSSFGRPRCILVDARYSVLSSNAGRRILCPNPWGRILRPDAWRRILCPNPWRRILRPNPWRRILRPDAWRRILCPNARR
jgi:hypothetical protein